MPSIQQSCSGPHSAPAALGDLIDHIDHIAKVAGVDHVGLGSDFDGVNGQLPEGMDSPADLPKITAALMARGYSAEDCRKILGGNLLRVFREVEAVSKQLQAENRPRITVKQPFGEQWTVDSEQWSVSGNGTGIGERWSVTMVGEQWSAISTGGLRAEERYGNDFDG